MRVPSTQALRALDAFARHGSVWRAAEELRLTRSAVSHQLRFLERDLGFDLLKRAGKGVSLTPQGQRYAAEVRKALTSPRRRFATVRRQGHPRIADHQLHAGLRLPLALYPRRRVQASLSRRRSSGCHAAAARRCRQSRSRRLHRLWQWCLAEARRRVAERGRVHAALQSNSAQSDWGLKRAVRRARRDLAAPGRR